jgi:hypothetical protein
MTYTIDTTLKRRLPAKLAAGFTIAAMLALGAFAGSAEAQYRHQYGHYYNGGYYRAPPVVYGSPYGNSYYGNPYYYPPPVIYGPSIGFSIGGIGIGIR